MLKILYSDLNAYSHFKTIKIKIVLFSHTFHLLILYRVSTYFHNNFWFFGKIISILIEYLIRVIYSSDISSKSIIGSGLLIQHGMNIVIGRDVIIGKNCKLYNGVTLGNKDIHDPVNAQPILGDNVIIGTGAKCLGGIKIGNNSIVGANSVVLKDVPDNSIVAGIPAKIIKTKVIL